MLPLTLKLWLWANPMTEDPGRPASCSNCSSGGENTAFFCVKMSPPPVAKKRSVCTGVATASQLPRPDTMLRHTDSRFLNSATVWNGFENAYGAVDGQVAPSHTLAGAVAVLSCAAGWGVGARVGGGARRGAPAPDAGGVGGDAAVRAARPEIDEAGHRGQGRL